MSVTPAAVIGSTSTGEARSSPSIRLQLPIRWFMSWMKPEMTVKGLLMSWMILA